MARSEKAKLVGELNRLVDRLRELDSDLSHDFQAMLGDHGGGLTVAHHRALVSMANHMIGLLTPGTIRRPTEKT